MKYHCRCCGWIYEEKKGEIGCDIDPDTPFDELPEDFECPEYYADKMSFYELEA